MSSNDPSQVDSLTLIKSCMNDLAQSQNHLTSFFNFFRESQVTLHELMRRNTPGLPLYKSSRASPAPMRGRHFICDEVTCGNFPDAPMMEDSVWYSMPDTGPKTLLCIGCTEKRLGRRIRMSDLKDCPGNSFTFLIHDRLTGAS